MLPRLVCPILGGSPTQFWWRAFQGPALAFFDHQKPYVLIPHRRWLSEAIRVNLHAI
jgi:hypothetical protein